MRKSTAASWLWLSLAGTLWLAGCGSGSGASHELQQQPVTVSVSPKLAAVVVTTQSQLFTATVIGGIGDLTVTWSVDGTAGGSINSGTITTSGLYTPPATAGTHTVTATSVALPTSLASASVAVTDLAGVFTYHNDLARDGANTQEYALTPSTVATNHFGKLFSCPVDGAVYTQPLWIPAFSIAGGTHNIVVVATQHDSVYVIRRRRESLRPLLAGELAGHAARRYDGRESRGLE